MKRLVSAMLALSIVLSLTTHIAYAWQDNISSISEQYLTIIKSYKTAQDNKFYKNAYNDTTEAEKAGINTELMLATSVNNLHYALIDLANDGVPELFIADISNDDGDYCIYDTYGYAEGKTNRLFDTYSMGYRSLYKIMSDGIIQCSGSGGAVNHLWEYYKINSNSTNPVMVQFVEYDGMNGDTYYTGTDIRNDKKKISEAEYNNIVSSYDYEQNIRWYPISDFESIKAELQSYEIPKIILNGNNISFDQTPIIVNDRVLVPIRAIFEAMDYTVTWNEATQTATAVNGSNKIMVQVGSSVISYTTNDKSGTYTCDVTPQIVSDRILVPVRAIAESAGCSVSWDENTQTVIIVK